MGSDKNKSSSSQGKITSKIVIRPHLKKWVAVTFYDHAFGSKSELRGSIRCTAVGRVYKIDKMHVFLQTWKMHGDKRTEDQNVEGFQILKKNIINIYEIDMPNFLL